MGDMNNEAPFRYPAAPAPLTFLGCSLVAKGHNLHATHARLAEVGRWEDAEIVGVKGKHIELRTLRGASITRWHHNPHALARMARAAADPSASVRWAPDYHVLEVVANGRKEAAYLSDFEMTECDALSGPEVCV